MMGPSYAAEKYSLARDLMATGHGVLRKRLCDAVVYQLRYVMPDRDLPEGLREEHERLMARVRCIPGERGRIAERLAAVAGHEPHEIVEEVLYLEYRIRSLYQAPPWLYSGYPTALIRVMPEPSDPEPFIQGPGAN